MHALPTGLRNAARSRKHSHSNWICFRQDLQRRAACVTFPGSAGFTLTDSGSVRSTTVRRAGEANAETRSEVKEAQRTGTA